ncbi:ArdC family protein [Microvirga pudoricolor]|uniref:ArdC family protein n=1 Tax=Microvirga pudoricolor TaxID=2778729 RepID=UPI00194FB6DF|nr:zincin-like metallopeptidase domain-containing protein [Microvirga pudoricolor]MBM6595429.1 DUF1738 domain-containing protein [Microvirga pudoricolor]
MARKTSETPRVDPYARVTSRIVADLEQGVRPWVKPWSAGNGGAPVTRPLRANGLAYQGINVLTLWTEAMLRGYTASTWMTYKQAADLGGQVRKGETSSTVFKAGTFTKEEQNSDTGEKAERSVAYLKAYSVFNVEQVDGLPTHFYAKAETKEERPFEVVEAAEAFFRATGSTIRHGGDRAFYSPGLDFIQMPPHAAFKDAVSYYATLGHEHIHWTGHGDRLGRTFGKRFGDSSYAFEELVAELGAAFLCADLALTLEPRADHASYIESWIRVLKQDSRAVFSAAGHAERAVRYLTGATLTADESNTDDQREAA